MKSEQKIQKCVDSLTQGYEANVTYDTPCKKEEYINALIVDPSGRGLSFVVTFNSAGVLSSMDIQGYNNHWINDWEGFTPEEMKAIARAVIEGRVEQRNRLRSSEIKIRFGDKSVSAKHFFRESKRVSSYNKKTNT